MIDLSTTYLGLKLRSPIVASAGPHTSDPLTVERLEVAGVHSGDDVIKALLVGADVAMMTSALLRNGAHHVRAVTEQLRSFLVEHEYESVA